MKTSSDTAYVQDVEITFPFDVTQISGNRIQVRLPVSMTLDECGRDAMETIREEAGLSLEWQGQVEFSLRQSLQKAIIFDKATLR